MKRWLGRCIVGGFRCGGCVFWWCLLNGCNVMLFV